MLREPFDHNPIARESLLLLGGITDEPAFSLSKIVWPHLHRQMDRACTLMAVIGGMAHQSHHA